MTEMHEVAIIIGAVAPTINLIVLLVLWLRSHWFYQFLEARMATMERSQHLCEIYLTAARGYHDLVVSDLRDVRRDIVGEVHKDLMASQVKEGGGS
jgi:hypothetical protein